MNKNKKLLEKSVSISNKFGFNITIDEIIEHYSESHRHWHVLNHLYEVLDEIEELLRDKKINDREYDILIIAAIFHDIIYDPKRNDNEEKSIDYMINKFEDNPSWSNTYNMRQNEDIQHIIEIIIGTKTHDSKDKLCKKFNKIDTRILDKQFIDMLDWENKIYKENKWAGWKIYKKNRIKFLLKSIEDHGYNAINIKNLIDYLNNKIPKIGICYYEIDKLPTIKDYVKNIDKISNLFDNVVIVIVYNSDNYSKEIIKEYGSNSQNNEFNALNETDIVGYFSHQSGNVTVIKELKYIDKYNKNIEKHIIKNFEDFGTIYI